MEPSETNQGSQILHICHSPADPDSGAAAGRESLRVRLETLRRITEFSEHRPDGREAEESERVVVEVLPVLGEPAASIEPADGSLDEPALRLADEAFGAVATFDDLDLEMWQCVGDAVVENPPSIGTFGEHPAQERELSEQGGQQQHAPVAVLNVGGGDQRVQQQAEFVDQNMTLLALDQGAGIEAMRIDRGPPFAALFTLWLSTMQAVGLASRSAWSRHLTYSA